ncbi:MAG: hypothetical protein Q7S76_02645 [bacterium]|nr:hypothetical protein [bacterium]
MTSILTRDVSSKTQSLISLLAMLFLLPFLVWGALEVVRIVSRAAGVPATIVIDNNALEDEIDLNFIHAFAQGGEESVDMLAPVISEVRSLSPRLIRLDHLYDHYSVVDRTAAGLTFDFSRLDHAVATIRAVGATPVLALSYMPSAIARDGVIINPPNNWDEWSLVVQRTIEHYSGRSRQNLRGVYYEVWNEPDLEQFGGWRLYGDKNYLTLYRYAAVGAERAQNVNAFSLGGPATTGLYKNWIVGLISSGNRMDFLSWHTYLADPTRYKTDQENLIAWLAPYPTLTDIPELISEFGFTGAKSTLYGTSFVSAHTAAVVRQLVHGGPSYLFSFQLKDGPGQTAGDGWGLITHEDNGKRLKPRYGVYSFLDPMEGIGVRLTGEGTWVTGFATTKGPTIRVMLVNFDIKGTHVETVPVNFINLLPGQFTLRQRFYRGQDTTTQETVAGSTLTKQIYMPAQSILMLELTKL